MGCDQTASLFRTSRHRSGISSIYLMLAVMLAIVVVPTWLIYSHFQLEHQRGLHAENKMEINEAVELWVNQKEYWPKRNLSDIAKDKNYLPNGLPINPMNGQAYSLDRVTHLVH